MRVRLNEKIFSFRERSPEIEKSVLKQAKL